MKRYLPLFVLLPATFLLACNLSRILADKPESPVPENASPTSAGLPTTEIPTTQPPIPLIYYHFVEVGVEIPPAGSVVIMPDEIILAPGPSNADRGADTAANIRSALQAMIEDPRNLWESTDVSITTVTFNEGAADVVLQGDYFGVGDIILIAARMQILLTVFAEPSVQTATITLNDQNIAYLGSSRLDESTPSDYTRAEIEIFITENAYTKP